MSSKEIAKWLKAFTHPLGGFVPTQNLPVGLWSENYDLVLGCAMFALALVDVL